MAVSPRNKTKPKEKRVPVPAAAEAELRKRAGGFCVCLQRGQQVHHLDDDRTNNDIDNLVWVCGTCHIEAGITAGSARRLRPSVLRIMRADLYKRVHAHLKWQLEKGEKESPNANKIAVKRERDFQRLTEVMRTLDIPAVERFIERMASKSFNASDEVHWLAFSRVVESGRFLLYDKPLEKRIMSLRSYWETVMLKAKVLFSSFGSSTDDLRMLNRDLWTKATEKDVDDLEAALFGMDASLRLLLMEVHHKHVELNTDETSAQARISLLRYR